MTDFGRLGHVAERMQKSFKKRNGIVLFLRSEGLKAPVPLSEILQVEKEMREALPEGAELGGAGAPQESEWSATDTPDQVKLVDLLQSLTGEMRTSKKERLAIIVSAWDQVDGYGSAEDFVGDRLPLAFPVPSLRYSPIRVPILCGQCAGW